MDTISGKPRDLSEINSRTDSRDILAHARQQADQRGFDDVFIVDIDSHVDDVGNWPEIMDYIDDPVVREAASSFSDGSKRGAFITAPRACSGRMSGAAFPRARAQGIDDDSDVPREIELSRRCMAQMGLDYQVVFPTPCCFSVYIR